MDEKKKQKVYVSGKITGRPLDEAKANFDAAKESKDPMIQRLMHCETLQRIIRINNLNKSYKQQATQSWWRAWRRCSRACSFPPPRTCAVSS